MNAANPIPSPVDRRGALRWPLFVVGLLVAHVLLMCVAVVVITRGNRDALVPEYRKAATAAAARAAGSRP